MVRLMLLGGPGAGKGTQALKLVAHFNIPHISTGDMLRSAIAQSTALGLAAKQIMAQGELVSDEIIIALVKERLAKDDCKAGFLLDGFPRTLNQAYALEQAQINIAHVVEIDVAPADIIDRISGRWVHVASGRVYHTTFNPPKVLGIDDKTQEPLIQRNDDKKETIIARLAVYRQQTAPLIDYYQQLSCEKKSALRFNQVDGSGTVADVFSAILQCITAV